jgi:hypothetical protein
LSLSWLLDSFDYSDFLVLPYDKLKFVGHPYSSKRTQATNFVDGLIVARRFVQSGHHGLSPTTIIATTTDSPRANDTRRLPVARAAICSIRIEEVVDFIEAAAAAYSLSGQRFAHLSEYSTRSGRSLIIDYFYLSINLTPFESSSWVEEKTELATDGRG